MALSGLAGILYYGILASLTGGYLPIRGRRVGLPLFHLALFLTFLAIPIIVFFVEAMSWVGWFVYSLLILVLFFILKIVNIRLHLSLGTDPLPEPEAEPEQEHETDEGDQENQDTIDDAPDEQTKVLESAEDDKSVPSHADSVELNKSTSLPTPSQHTASYELQAQGSSEGVAVVEVEPANNEDTDSKDTPSVGMASSESTLRPPLPDDPSAVALMSPVHRSTSNIDTSYTTVLALLDGSREEITKDERHSISEGTTPPRRDRTAAGICIQRNRSIAQDEVEESFHHQRRHAVRQQSRGSRRHSSPATASSVLPSATPTLSPLPASPLIAPPQQCEHSNYDNVKAQLYEDEQFGLIDVVDKMPPGLHEAILLRNMPASCYQSLASRVEELRRGHLATGDGDSTAGAIHWFEVNGEWNFYVFEADSSESVPVDDIDDEIEAYFSYRVESIRRQRHYPAQPEEVSKEEEKLPTFRILPFVKKTTVELKFARKTLEEFMDRNVTWVEALGTVGLATLVCVVAALLLSLVNFYEGVTAVIFCFVVATAHFSLIKSVEDDPASPSPGQNHITALSRAVYFIFVGVLALSIDGALTHLSPEYFNTNSLVVFGHNINSVAVLMFVRNGLLIFILFLPIIFMLGWLPQADTFTIWFCEQLDIHVFGGTPATGLVCGVYSLARSVAVGALLWPLGWAAFHTLDVRGRLGDPGYSPDFPGRSCIVNDRVALAFFIGAIFATSFVLSRSTSNHQYLWDLMCRAARRCKACFNQHSPEHTVPPDLSDPLEDIYCQTVCMRLLYDLMAGVFVLIFVTGLNLTTIFCLNPIPSYVIYGLTAILGVINHYIIPHMRKEMPWLVCSEPLVKPHDWDSFEVTEEPKLSVVERLMQWSKFLEKNVFYPLTFLFALNLSAHHYKIVFGEFGAALVVTVVGLKLVRSAFTELSRQHFVLIFALFFFNFDYAHLSEGLPLNYFIISILFYKFYDLLLKMYFIYIYIVPWQTSWSSAGHIITQPLLVPHTPIIFLQTLIASILGAPINPVYASTLFMLSYTRPVKYWEKNYNTKRADSSNTRLDLQLEGNLRNPNPDRLDSLFYEHLTWVLQRSLCGDLALGRWGNVTSGDIFILTSDRLNALVHIIEYGNGFVTFQLRGLEFRGTYCHQREVEAITESVAGDDGCCCCEPGHIPCILSCNKTFSLRWLAWQVVSSCYTLHGYSIAENQAHLVFNSYDHRRSYITYYCKCIIYNLISSPRLKGLLENEGLQTALERQHQADYVDPDPLFDDTRNCDYSHSARGVERLQFVASFQPFIQVCVEQKGLELDYTGDSFLVTLCFAYTLLGRRMFFQHAQQGAGRRGGDNFMHGLYKLFIGDARPNSENDEWIFEDVDSIKDFIIPAARTALKVHQDNFTFSEEYDSPIGVYEAIEDVHKNHVVTHENDRAWRNAVIMNQPSMLALRYQRTEESYVYPYKLIRLTSKFIKFRVVKLNRECVRSLWTSQQQELIYFHNSDSERGSIQNHKPTLRNMVNSSMDLPIGYPIYVSPLQTSYIDRHQTYNDTIISKLTNPLEIVKAASVIKDWCKACSKKMSGSRNQTATKETHSGVVEVEGARTGSVDSLTGMQYGTERQQPYVDPFPDSDSDGDEQLWKPMWVSKTVAISDTSEIFENFNTNWLKWKDVSLAQKALKSHWKAWRPQEGMEGEVVHEWRPFHLEAVHRSHIDKIILLVKMTEDLYVLVKEQGVRPV